MLENYYVYCKSKKSNSISIENDESSFELGIVAVIVGKIEYGYNYIIYEGA